MAKQSKARTIMFSVPYREYGESSSSHQNKYNMYDISYTQYMYIPRYMLMVYTFFALFGIRIYHHTRY